MQYVNKLRMDTAKQALMATDSSVSEIAASVGMELAHFSMYTLNYCFGLRSVCSLISPNYSNPFKGENSCS
jgi:AraC-like DNA-binding protein